MMSLLKRLALAVLVVVASGGLMGAASQSSRFYLIAPAKISIQNVDAITVSRLFKGIQSQLDGQRVNFVVRKERAVSDHFLGTYLHDTWFAYLDNLNQLFFQQRLRMLPPILSLDQYIALNSNHATMVTYASEQDLADNPLPSSLKAIPLKP